MLQKFLVNVSGKTKVMQHVDDKKLYKDFAFVHLLKLFNSSVCNRQLLLHFYVFFLHLSLRRQTGIAGAVFISLQQEAVEKCSISFLCYNDSIWMSDAW